MLEQLPVVHVALDETTTDQEQAAVQDLFAGKGIKAAIELEALPHTRPGIASSLSRHDPGNPGPRNHHTSSWTVILHSRVNALTGALGPATLRESVEGLRALLAKQRKTSPADGLVLLTDEDTGVRLELDFQLPLRAFEDLRTLSLSGFHSDPVRFHRRSGPHGAWRSPS